MGGVGVFAREKLLETPFWIVERGMGRRDARRFKTRGTDGNQECCLRLPPAFEVAKAPFDEIAAGKRLVAHASNIRFIPL